jgi:hypothetical protein
MSMWRFTRLTNAFSKKIENHAAAVALYFIYLQLRSDHQTLRTTPAIAAGVTDRVSKILEIIALLDHEIQTEPLTERRQLLRAGFGP